MHLNTYLFGLDDLISGFWEIGLRTMYDSKNKKQQDILSIEGFFLGLLQCLRLRRKGLLWIGCPCHSFTWMCSSKHQRTPATPLGNTNLDFVVQGNKVAARSILLALICMARGGFYFLEQPAGSALDVYPYMTFLMQLASPGLSCSIPRWYHVCYNIRELCSGVVAPELYMYWTHVR